ncbi:MAG: hypothetical protein RL186_410 [Pseudomonadota bacterium]|jgi:hypothetical protein
MGGLDASAMFSVVRLLHRPPSQPFPTRGKGFSSVTLANWDCPASQGRKSLTPL